MTDPITLRDGDHALAVVHPQLGGWLTRYARQVRGAGWVDVLQDDPAVVGRYPDRMWAGNPILFPHVSYNTAEGKEGVYQLNGTTYASVQHGFARRIPWRVVDRGADFMTQEITDSELTRPSYPFAFSHRVTYRLREGRLLCEQTIENRDRAPLPFSTGFHPYFRLPLTGKGNRQRSYLRLPRATRYNPIGKAESFFEEPVAATRLSTAVDVSGTVFLGDLATREIALVDPDGGVEAVLNFETHPAYRFVALWARSPEDPFYCIEPWTALPNSFGRSDGEVIILPPGDRFQAGYWIDARPATDA